MASKSDAVVHIGKRLVKVNNIPIRSCERCGKNRFVVTNVSHDKLKVECADCYALVIELVLGEDYTCSDESTQNVYCSLT